MCHPWKWVWTSTLTLHRTVKGAILQKEICVLLTKREKIETWLSKLTTYKLKSTTLYDLGGEVVVESKNWLNHQGKDHFWTKILPCTSEIISQRNQINPVCTWSGPLLRTNLLYLLVPKFSQCLKARVRIRSGIQVIEDCLIKRQSNLNMKTHLQTLINKCVSVEHM